MRRFALVAVAALALVALAPSTAEAPKESLPRLVSVRNNGPILRLYLATLDRLPDRAGLQYWSDLHDEGTDLETIAALFMASPEFVERFGQPDDETFVRLVYSNVLDRTPDRGGLYYWTDLLDEEYPRSVIVTGFANSPEFVARTDQLLEQQAGPLRVLMIGDSIFHGIRLLDLPLADLDPTWMTEEGRHPSALPELLARAGRNGTLAATDAVVIHLGTNSWQSSDGSMFEAQLAALTDKRVVVVNVEAGRPWEAKANTELFAIAERWDNVTLADWNATVAADPSLLRPDGVHPTERGLHHLGELVTFTLHAS